MGAGSGAKSDGEQPTTGDHVDDAPGCAGRRKRPEEADDRGGRQAERLDGSLELSRAPDKAHRVDVGIEGEKRSPPDHLGGRGVVLEAAQPVAHRRARTVEFARDLAGASAGRRAKERPPVPRQEPSAVVPHAGICAGGRPHGRPLPRSFDDSLVGWRRRPHWCTI